MAVKPIKIVFELDGDDIEYFKKLFQKAQRSASKLDPDQVLSEGKKLVKKIRNSKRVPPFVLQAIEPLDHLVHLLEDKDYEVPDSVRKEILATLAYFSDPHDLIPDSIPGLGYLDDAIMTRILEQQFEAELWGYRKFCTFRDRAEQRPWTSAARARLPERLADERRKIREQITERRTQRKGRGLFGLDW
jgi:uncharacterized membrane protein YkvA (DUF1232 family)